MHKPNTVAELLEKPENWIQGKLAKDVNKLNCNVDDPAARCWCLVGAIRYVYGNDTVPTLDPPFFDWNPQTKEALNKAESTIEKLYPEYKGFAFTHIPSFNDAPNRTHAEVLEVVNLAGI